MGMSISAAFAIPLIRDIKKTFYVLEDLIEEINCIMKIFEDKKVQNIAEFNAVSIEKIPRIVFFIDDLADLMLDKSVFEKIEASICSITEFGGNVGIHLIVCTQRPDLKVFSKKKSEKLFRLGLHSKLLMISAVE